MEEEELALQRESEAAVQALESHFSAQPEKQEASASASPLPRRGSREWAERVEKAEAERERLRSELERARRECDALHSRRKEQVEQLSRLELELAEARAKLEEHQRDEAAGRAHGAGRLQELQRAFAEKEDRLKERLAQREATLETKIAELLAEREVLRSGAAAAAAAEAEELRRRAEELEARLRAQEAENERLRAALQKQQTDRERMRDRAQAALMRVAQHEAALGSEVELDGAELLDSTAVTQGNQADEEEEQAVRAQATRESKYASDTESDGATPTGASDATTSGGGGGATERARATASFFPSEQVRRTVEQLSLVAHAVVFLYLFGSFVGDRHMLKLLAVQIAAAVFTWFRLAKYVRSEHEMSAAVRGAAAPASRRTGAVQMSDSLGRVKLRRKLSSFEKVPALPPNPFVNLTWKIDEEERRRLCLAAVTIFPLRALGVLLGLVLAALAAKLGVWGLSDEELKRPLSPARRLLVVWPVRLMARAILLAAGFYWIETRGRKASASEAPIIVSNHISFLENFFLVHAFMPAAVASRENVAMPLVGAVVRGMQCILVDRTSADSRKQVLNAILERVKEPGWPQTLIFPEGTTTNGRALITFKKGAFVPGLPVQPCLLRVLVSRVDPSWLISGPSLGSVIFRVLCEPANWMSYEFLPPYAPSPAERADASLFAQNVRQRMCEALGVESTDYAFEDVQLQREALKLELPPDQVVVGFGALQSAFQGVTVEQVAQRLEKFAEFDRRGRGRLSLEEFAEAFGLPLSPEVRNLFALLDPEDRGEIGFREYLVGLGLVNATDEAQVVHLAFRIFDLDGDGKVDVADLRRLFRVAFPDASEADAERLLSGLRLERGRLVSPDEFRKLAHAHPECVEVFKRAFKLQ